MIHSPYRSGSSRFPSRRVLPRAAVCLLLALTLALGFFSPTVGAQGKADMRTLGYIPEGIAKTKFQFIVGSDSHIGAAVGNKGTSQAVRDIQEHHQDAAFMIHMGDVTETGAAREYDLFREYTATLPFKVYATMGNHESRWQDRQGSLFAQNFGAKNYSFDYGLWHFVVLDTTYPGQTLGTLDPATISWVEKDLAALPKTKPVAVFSHHPFCYGPRAFQDSDDAFVGLLDRYPIRVIFSGHGHSFITWKTQGRTFEMVGALMDAAYAVVDVSGSDMSVYSVTGAGTPQREKNLLLKISEVPKPSPITEFTVRAEDGLLTGSFLLSEAASVAYQIDGGSYQSLGHLQEGQNQLSCSIAAHAKGTHTIRIKATTNVGPYFACQEFGKDPSDLQAWRTELGSAALGNIVDDKQGGAIVGTRDGMIRNIRVSDGFPLWEHRCDSAWGGGAIADGKLYFGTASGHLYCLNASEGTLIWSTTLDKSGFPAPPLVNDAPWGKSVIVGSSSGTVYSVNPFTGITQWKYQAEGAVTSTPRSMQGRVFFGAWDGSLYALDLKDGTLAWRKNLGRQIYYSPSLTPALASDLVYVTTPYDGASGGSYLYAISASTGEEIWKHRSGSSLLGASIPGGPWPKGYPGSHLTVLDATGGTSILSQRDGKVLYRIDGTTSLFTTFASGDGLWVTGGYRGVLNLVFPNSRFDYKIRDSFLMQEPLIARGVLVQSDSRGTLWGINIIK